MASEAKRSIIIAASAMANTTLVLLFNNTSMLLLPWGRCPVAPGLTHPYADGCIQV
jgi:hypothetical protein